MKINQYSSLISKNQGFTLIEVMISAIILFSALALSAELFKASSFSADKAARSAQFYQVHPVAMAAIKLDLKEQAYNKPQTDFSGQMMLFGINYQWQARQVSLAKPAVSQESNRVVVPRFGLYDVDVNAEKINKNQQFSFQVATW
jgi:prepilin-type N-terminal cleavage/methylation domain-containing protein